MNKLSLLACLFLLLFSCKTEQPKTPPPESSVQLELETKTLNHKEGDCTKGHCATIDLNYPFIKSGLPALKKKVALWSNDFLISLLDPALELDSETSLSSAVDGFVEGFKEYAAEQSDETIEFSLEVKNKTLLQNDIYLTLRMDAYSNTGGAHPNTTAAVATFDLKTGKQVRPIDVVKDMEKLYALAEQKFEENQKEAFDDGFEFSSNQPFDLPKNVGLTAEGLLFCYVPYEVAPYAMGFTEFIIPYDELEKL